MSDPLEDLIIKQNWCDQFRQALRDYTITANILNSIVRDGNLLFGKETCSILCANEKNKVVDELKKVQQSRGTYGKEFT